MHEKSFRMKSLLRSLLLVILFTFSKTLISQDAVKVLDRVYGLDQTLCNGKKYDYFLPSGTRGYQYLLSPDYVRGSVTLRGKNYTDVALNYDIFNQQLLLKYEDEKGSVNIIEVSKAWLTDFSLGNMNFELRRPEHPSRLYQVLGEGPVRILYYWWKNLGLDAAIGSSGYAFTRAVRDAYVLMDGKLRPFSTNKSLVGLFAPKHRQEIKSYLRKNKVKVKKASDQVMAEMITFIGNIR
jgi:hypothetical protein